MRIRGAQKPPPYFNRRDQYRMLMLIALLGVTLLAIKTTARPGFWSWMFPPQKPSNAPTETAEGDGDNQASPAAVDHVDHIDHSVLFDRELASDEFLAQTQHDTSRTAPSAPDTETDDSDASGNGSEDAHVGDPAPAEVSRDVIPLDLKTAELDPAFLRGVVDRRVGLRQSEADAYFGLLAKISRLPQSVLADAEVLEANYTVLMTEPEYYRGRLVRLQGVVKRLVGFSAAENPYGVQTLYDVWLFTRDSGNNPIHIRCTEVPRGIPQGLSISKDVEVTVTGYFFRIEGYESQGGLHTAPLVLANGLQWHEPVELTRSQKAIVPYVGTFVALVTLALVVVLWKFRRSDRAYERSHLRELAEPDASGIAELRDLPTTDVQDFLRSLHEEQDAAQRDSR